MSGDRGAIIVGAGQAGARAAKAMRSAGYRGAISLLGAEPHLPYERPILSKAMLMEPGTPVPFVMGSEDYAAAGIEVRTDAVVIAIDPTKRSVTLADGSRLLYDRLLIATGSRLRTVSIDGVAPENILTLRTLDDCRVLAARLRGRPSVVVIGGGFIGLEVASSAAALGCRVAVIETAERLLPRLCCPEASAAVLEHHRAAGIEIHLKSTVARGTAATLCLLDGPEISADVIIAGIGVVPETALAAAAGVKVDDGVLVDEYGATSNPFIFAAGDVTRHYNPVLKRHVRLESWQNANHQSEAAGRSMAGVPTVSAEIPWLWSDQGNLNLQMAGAPSACDRAVVRGDPLGAEGATYFQFLGGQLVGGITINRGKEMPLIRRLLAQPDISVCSEALADDSIPLRRLMSLRNAG